MAKAKRKSFVNRGGVRKYMDRLFPNDKVEYIYARNSDGRFYPIITAIGGSHKQIQKDHATVDANNILVNADIETV